MHSIINATIVAESRQRQRNILHFHSLKPDTYYTVCLITTMDDDDDVVVDVGNHIGDISASFMTLPLASPKSRRNSDNVNDVNDVNDNIDNDDARKILVLSCNRIYEDHDSVMIREQVLRDEHDRFGVIHLGDQVYADSVMEHLLTTRLLSSSLTSFENDGDNNSEQENDDDDDEYMIEMFRHVYRMTWHHDGAMRRVMRQGAHWMIPDDHDIINNLDDSILGYLTDKWMNKWMNKMNNGSTTSHESNHDNDNRSIGNENKDKMRRRISQLIQRVIHAGRIAFYEYQYSIRLPSSMMSSDTSSSTSSSTSQLLLPCDIHEYHIDASSSSLHSSNGEHVVVHEQKKNRKRNTSDNHDIDDSDDRTTTTTTTTTTAVSDSPSPTTRTYPKVYFSKVMFHTCFLFMDFRFERTFAHRDPSSPTTFFIGQEQFQWLDQELTRCTTGDISLVLILSSTPVLAMSQSMSHLVHTVENERYSTHRDMLPETIQLLDMVSRYKTSTGVDIRLIGGDVHHFFLSQICRHADNDDDDGHENDDPSHHHQCIDQMVTSGITNGSSVLTDPKLLLFNLVNQYVQPYSIHAGPWYLHRKQNYEHDPSHHQKVTNENGHSDDDDTNDRRRKQKHVLQQFMGTNYGVLKFKFPQTADSDDRKPNLLFEWYGVARRNVTWEQHLTMELYDQFPTIRILLLLFVTGLSALPVTLIFTYCCCATKPTRATRNS